MRAAFLLTLAATGLMGCALFPDLHDLDGSAGDTGATETGATDTGANDTGASDSDAGASDASAEAPPTAIIRCGDKLTTCLAPATICCNMCQINDAGNCTAARDVSCIAPDAGSTCNDHSGGANAIPCSDPTACAADGNPADVCCGLLNGTVPDDSSGYLSVVQCMSLAECQSHVAGTTKSYDVLCDPTAANPCGGVNGMPDASCVLAQAAGPFSRCE